MRVLGIDPGLQATGWALFENGSLFMCGMFSAPAERDLGKRLDAMVWQAKATLPTTDFLVLEQMQVRQPRKQKGRQSDLIALSLLGGAFIGSVMHTRTLLPVPSEWNNGAPKGVTQNRLRMVLSPPEVAKVEGAARGHKGHNVWDAVGLGRWGVEYHEALTDLTNSVK